MGRNQRKIFNSSWPMKKLTKQSLTGVYTFFYKDMDNRVCCKVGKTSSRKNRIDEHLTSCAGLTEGPFFTCLVKEVNTLEAHVLDLFRKRFESIRKETFIIGDDLTKLETLNMIKSILPPDLLATMRTAKRTDVKDVDYKVNTLFGEEDVRNLRPKCDFLTGEDAMPITAAGVGEKWRSVNAWMTNDLKHLDASEKLNISVKAWKIWCMAKASSRREEEERQGEGRLY